MGGICGIVAVDVKEPIDEQALKRMTNAMQHRGPNDGEIWLSPRGLAGLGHRRLSIIDLSSAGKQPMVLPSNDTAVVLNGGIYNYKSIRESLLKRGHSFRSQTDTEVLLHLYEESGDGLVELIEGDYAFALWDLKKEQLTLVRDRVGVKPLYYAFAQGYFLFASEVRALLASGMINPKVDSTAFYHYLSYLSSPPNQTLVQSISKLEPSSMISIGSELGMTKTRYWEPLPNSITDIPQNHDDLQDMFEERIEQAVQKRLISDVPTGVLLSGGVDSTLNTGIFSAKSNEQNIHSFTVNISETDNNEEQKAAEMAKHLGTTHHNINVNEQDILTKLDHINASQDDPISDTACIPLYFASQLANEKGITVLQSGDGADELFCGYNSYIKYMNTHKKYWNKLGKTPSFITKAGGSITQHLPKLGRVSDVLQQHANGYPLFLSSTLGFAETDKKHIISEEFLNDNLDLSSWDIVEPYYQRLEGLSPNASFLQQMTFIELNMRIPELSLMRIDKMSIAHGTEMRMPFLDHNLIEFAMSVPDDFKLHNNIQKAPIKNMVSKFIPRNKAYIPRLSFELPIKQWLKGQMGEQLRELLNDTDNEQYFNTKHIINMLSKNNYSKNDAFQLWIVFNFLKWKSIIL